MILRPLIEWTDDCAICRNCDGTGCQLCGGRGDVLVEPQLERITCVCGWQCTGDKWWPRADAECPDCGTNLETEVEMSRPAGLDEPDYDDELADMGWRW